MAAGRCILSCLLRSSPIPGVASKDSKADQRSDVAGFRELLVKPLGGRAITSLFPQSCKPSKGGRRTLRELFCGLVIASKFSQNGQPEQGDAATSRSRLLVIAGRSADVAGPFQ